MSKPIPLVMAFTTLITRTPAPKAIIYPLAIGISECFNSQNTQMKATEETGLLTLPLVLEKLGQWIDLQEK